MIPKIKWAAIVLLMAAMALPASGQVSLVDNATWCVIRSMPSDLDQDVVNWEFKNFPTFYYDIDKNIGTEQITFKVSDVDAGNTTAILADTEGKRGIIYQTTAESKNFKFRPWGSYMIIGFLGEPYFAAYNIRITTGMIASAENNTPYLYAKSKNRNLMTTCSSARL